MKFSRRDLIKTAAAATGGIATGTAFGESAQGQESPTHAAGQSLPPAFDALKPLGDRVKPIRPDELQARVAHAQQLMTDSKPRFEALYVTPGTTLVYYTGIRWWPSERILAFVVPRQGDPLLVCPAFEEGRLREQLRWPIEIRVWQEDEDPYPIIEKWLIEHGIRTGQVGVEATTRYVFFDGLRHAATSLDYTSGDPITVGCRAQKSAHELELMRLACSATCAVYKAIFASLREGMTQREVSELAARGYARMGLQGEASAFFGPSSALPHGSREEQVLREGIGVMIDDGTTVEGYRSDVTRVGVLGSRPKSFSTLLKLCATRRMLRCSCCRRPRIGSVDDAARKVDR